MEASERLSVEKSTGLESSEEWPLLMQLRVLVVFIAKTEEATFIEK